MDPELSEWTPASGPATDRLASLISTHERDLRRVAVAITDDAQRADRAVLATWAWAERRVDALGTASEARARLLRRVAREAERRARPPWPARLRDRVRPSHAIAPDPGRDPVLTRVLAGLTSEDRRMLALRHAAGLTTEEIAGQLDLTGPGVRAHLDDLRGRLQSALAIPSTNGEGTPLTDLEIELRIAARLVVYLDRRAISVAPKDPATAARSLLRRATRRPRLNRRRLAVGTVVVLAILAVVLPLSLVPPSGPASTAPTPAPGTLLPIAGWDQRPLGSVDGLARVIGWAPDGAHVAVAGGGITIYDRSGGEVLSFHGDDAVWLDADRLLVLHEGGAGESGLSNLTLRSLAGRGELLVSLDTPGPVTEIVSGPSGSVAVLRRSFFITPPIQFSILRSGGFSRPMDGIPLAWTADGARLAYLAHPAPSTKDYRGVLHVLDAVTLADRDLAITIEDSEFSAIDGSGRYLLACVAPATGPDACVLGLVDLRNGTTQTSSILGQGTIASWAANGSVLVQQGGTMFRWISGSSPVALRWQPEISSPALGITPAGSRVAVGLLHGPGAARLVAGSEPPIIVVPGQSVRSLAASPDGTRLAFIETHLGLSTVMLVSLPAPPPASGLPAPSPVATPPATPGPTLAGLPLLAISDAPTWSFSTGNIDASWGPHVYMHDGGYPFDDEDGTTGMVPLELSVFDLADGSSRAIESPLTDEEELAVALTDGRYLVLEAFRRPGPPPSASNIGCPPEIAQPMAWRLLAAPLGTDGAPTAPFRVLDSGTASRVFSPAGVEGVTCPATVLPAVAVANEGVAYAVEAPAGGYPWATRISIRRLSDGTAVRTASTRATVEWLGLDEGIVAWTEREDASVTSEDGVLLQVIAPLDAAVQTLPLPAGDGQLAWDTFTTTGGGIVSSAGDQPGVALSSVYWLDPASGAAERISPAGAACWLGGAGDGMAIMSCDSLPGGLSLLWREDHGLALLDSVSYGDWSIAGGWIVTSDRGWETYLAGVPLPEVLR